MRNSWSCRLNNIKLHPSMNIPCGGGKNVLLRIRQLHYPPTDGELFWKLGRLFWKAVPVQKSWFYIDIRTMFKTAVSQLFRNSQKTQITHLHWEFRHFPGFPKSWEAAVFAPTLVSKDTDLGTPIQRLRVAENVNLCFSGKCPLFKNTGFT